MTEEGESERKEGRSAAVTHRALCAVAVRWLRKHNSGGGHGCSVAQTECYPGWRGEQPDAIGWRHAGFQDGSVLIEVKVSRADFLADARKEHRINPAQGVGKWRYFMCPEGLIDVDELPERWGLLWVSGKGTVKAVAGAAAALRFYTRVPGDAAYATALDLYAFPERNVEIELAMLARLVARVPSMEAANNKIREANNRANRLAALLEREREDNRARRMRWMAVCCGDDGGLTPASDGEERRQVEAGAARQLDT